MNALDPDCINCIYEWSDGQATPDASFSFLTDQELVLTIKDTTLNCEVSDTFIFEVYDQLQVDQVSFECDSINSSFIATILVSGGEGSGSYIHYGTVNGTFLNNSSTFVTQSLPVNQAFNVYFYSSNSNCDTLEVPINHGCNCESLAGNMDLSLTEFCANDLAQVTYLGGSFLDNNDQLFFALHEGAGQVLENVIAWSTSPEFGFQSPMQAEQIYYISPVVGNALLNSPDINDACLSVSEGTPIVFHEIPSVSIALSDSSICVGDSVVLSFQFSGGGPFTFLVNSETFESQSPAYALTFYPEIDTTYNVSNVLDNFSCLNNSTYPMLVNVDDLSQIIISDTLCWDESINVNGVVYNNLNPNGNQTYPGTGDECDTEVIIDLSFYEQSINAINEIICEGDIFVLDGLVIGEDTDTTIYLFEQDVNGCDSIIHIAIKVLDEDPICVDDSIVIPINLDTSFQILDNDSIWTSQLDWIVEIPNWNSDWPLVDLGGGMIGTAISNFSCDTITFQYEVCHNLCPMICDEGETTIFTTLPSHIDSTFIAPDVFTPNGDGQNDELIFLDIVKDPSKYPNAFIAIVNRWGQPVFERNHFNGRWDGRNENGQIVPHGVYYYILKLDIGEGEFRIGNVALVRH